MWGECTRVRGRWRWPCPEKIHFSRIQISSFTTWCRFVLRRRIYMQILRRVFQWSSPHILTCMQYIHIHPFPQSSDCTKSILMTPLPHTLVNYAQRGIVNVCIILSKLFVIYYFLLSNSVCVLLCVLYMLLERCNFPFWDNKHCSSLWPLLSYWTCWCLCFLNTLFSN